MENGGVSTNARSKLLRTFSLDKDNHYGLPEDDNNKGEESKFKLQKSTQPLTPAKLCTDSFGYGTSSFYQKTSTRMETIVEPADINTDEWCQDSSQLDEMHAEFERIIADIKGIEVYKKLVLDHSKCRLVNIVNRLENSRQQNQLLENSKIVLREVDAQMEKLRDHFSENHDDIISKKKENPSTQKPNKVKQNLETPFIDSNEVELLLIGSSGNGKSATGNSILRNNVFQTASGTSSIASTSARSSSKFKGQTINVVDSCGIDTNGKTNLEVLEETLKAIKESLELCNYSFTALLFVIKFGSRFTQHESDTVKMIRGVLGNDVIQKYGVCVVTHGDNFEYEMEEEEEEVGKVMTFEEWCHAQVGEIGAIFKECNFRCVLFNNKDKTKRESQLENLLSLIRHNEKYSRDEFLKAEEGLSKLMQELFLPEVLDNTLKLVKDMRSKLSTLKISFESNDFLKEGNVMLKELNQFKDNTLHAHWDESAKQKVLGIIEPLELEIKSKLRLCHASNAELGQTHKRNVLLKSFSLDESELKKRRNLEMRTTYGAGIQNTSISISHSDRMHVKDSRYQNELSKWAVIEKTFNAIKSVFTWISNFKK